MPTSDSPLLASLNPVQSEAVQHTEGPVLIFAGAGSGKTRVLTHRVAYLIAEKRVPPWAILAVTFTNKAAQEMRERIMRLVGEGGRSIWIGTFHATCARILRESGDRIGLDRNFVVYDDGDQIALVRESLQELQIDDKRFAPRAVLSQISRAKEKLQDPEEYRSRHLEFYEALCGRVYELYQEKLARNNALDFDDLLVTTVRLLSDRQDVLGRYQERFRYILVDEYQDVNYAQYLLMNYLAQKSRNICVVGDDDQSIYGWRGAEVELMLRFERDYPEARVIKLEQNYRSSRNILDAAHGVVSNNQGRMDKRLWTDRDAGRPVYVHEAGNEQEEALFIVQTVRDDVRNGRRSYKDFAVLYRTNAQSRALEEVFINFSTPYKIVGGVRFYERKEVKDVLAYLRVVENPLDSVSLKRVVNVPARGIGAGTLKILDDQAHAHGRALWDVVQDAHRLDALGARARIAVGAFARLIQGLRERREGATVTSLVQAVLAETGYLEELESDRASASQTRAENVRELLSVTTDFDSTAEDRSLSAFLEQVSLVSDLDDVDTGTEAVTLMTLHSAKGLEFPVVFVAGLEDGIFPHMRSMESDRELQEERRLCYVGMTRAQEELYLTHAYRRTLYGATDNLAPSRFLREIPAHVLDGRAGGAPAAQEVSVPRQDWTTWGPRGSASPRMPDVGGFRVGQKVRHAGFGVGVVLSAEPVGEDVQVSVAFPEVGIKKLLQSIAKLRPA
jgi:DNA helicase II / ATP-dependent DNA helicase PcrA